MSLIPTPAQTLRHFAEWLDGQAARYDHLLWRDRGERSTVAETYRQIASQARQQAHRYQRLAALQANEDAND
jgi:replicative DNA helicase